MRKKMRVAAIALLAFILVGALASCGETVSPESGEESGDAGLVPEAGYSADEQRRTVADPGSGTALVDPDTDGEVTLGPGVLLPEGGGSPYVPIAGYETGADGREYYRGRVRVEFGAGVPEERMREVVSEAGCEWGRGDVYHDGTTSVTARVEVGDEEAAIGRLSGYPEVSVAWREAKSEITFDVDLGEVDGPIDDAPAGVGPYAKGMLNIGFYKFSRASASRTCRRTRACPAFRARFPETATVAGRERGSI